MMRVTVHQTSELALWHLDRLVIETAMIGLVIDRIQADGHPVPGYMTAYHEELARATDYRVISDAKLELEREKARRSTLMSKKDKLAESDARIAELEKKLGLQKAEEAKK
jgi:hypothetical protein